MSKYEYKALQKNCDERSFMVVGRDGMIGRSYKTFEEAQWASIQQAMGNTDVWRVVEILSDVCGGYGQAVGELKPHNFLFFKHYPSSNISQLANKSKSVLDYLSDQVSQVIHRRKISDNIDELIREPQTSDIIN